MTSRSESAIGGYRRHLQVTLILGILLAVAATEFWWNRTVRPIKVGLLHSRTGAMAISESSMVDAEILALEQINAAGGLLGRPVEWVIADGESDWPTFAREAERLITDEQVDVIFGCWTSASRKTVLPIIEENKHLLIYPMAYEGLEYSPYVICTGAAPNQQITPSIAWAIRTLGAKRFYLVGSDYIWPHCVNEISKDILKSVGADLAGESYLLFGTDDVKDVVADIVRKKPDVIISTVVGDTNRYFYRELGKAGVRSDTIPVISYAIAEDELRALLKDVPAEDLVGHYSAWNYFQTVDTPANKVYLEALRARYGPEKVANDVMTASYNSVRLWAQAVVEAESTEVEDVVNAIGRQSLAAPEGIVTVDSWTNHTWRPVYIAKARGDGLFDIVWSSGESIRPVPYPNSRRKQEWERLLNDLYTAWGNTWANPGDRAIPPIASKRRWIDDEPVPAPTDTAKPPADKLPAVVTPVDSGKTRPDSPPGLPASSARKPEIDDKPQKPDANEPVIDEQAEAESARGSDLR